MKKTTKLNSIYKIAGIIALIAIIGFSIAGCDNGSGTRPNPGPGNGPGNAGGGNTDLTGTITITPNTDVMINTELTATYSGTETVTYQWRRGTTNVGTNLNKFTPTTAGSYTVTVSATGFNSKTSTAVTVTDDGSGKLTITNIPSLAKINELLTELNEWYIEWGYDFQYELPWTEVYVHAFSGETCYVFSANKPTVVIEEPIKGKGVRVTGSTVTLNAYTIDWEGDWETIGYVPFDGDYTFKNPDDYLIFIFSNIENFGVEGGEWLLYYNLVDVVFTNGIGTISFDDMELD